MLVCTTGCSDVANLRLPPQARSKRVPPSLDASQSTSLSRSLSRSLLMSRTCNPATVSTCTYLVVAKNNIRPPCLNFAVYSTYMLPRRLRLLDVLLVTTMVQGVVHYTVPGGKVYRGQSSPARFHAVPLDLPPIHRSKPRSRYSSLVHGLSGSSTCGFL